MTTGIARRKATTAIVVHSALTFPDQPCDAKIIRGWHVKNGWSDIGYHLVIRRDGVAEVGRPLDRVGAHTVGRNHDSIGIVLAGGLDRIGQPGSGTVPIRFVKAATGYKDAAIAANYTPAQLITLRDVVRSLMHQIPSITEVLGHRDAVKDSRPCPCFSVKTWFANGMVPSVKTSLEGDPE